MREGDIYRWKWKPELGRNDWGAFGDYHCKSQIAIVHKGKPLDTFWMNFGSSFKQKGWAESRSGAHSVCTNSANFELIANLDELEEIRHGEEVYHRNEDIVDLRNSNNSSAPVYRRKGTARDKAIMIDLLDDKISGCEHAIRSAEYDIKMYHEKREKVVSGDLDVFI